MFHLFWNWRKHKHGTERKWIKPEMTDRAPASRYLKQVVYMVPKKGNILNEMFLTCLCQMCSMCWVQKKHMFIIEIYFHYSAYQITAEQYVKMFPSSLLSTKSSIKQIVDHFRTSWSAELKKKVQSAPVLTPKMMHDTSIHMGIAMDTLVWKLMTQTGIKPTSIFCALNQLKLDTYCATLVQELKPPNLPCYLHFCCWFLNFVCTHSVMILGRVYFSDEAWFHHISYINAHNYRFQSSENLYVFFKYNLHPDKIGIWCAVSQHHVKPRLH